MHAIKGMLFVFVGMALFLTVFSLFIPSKVVSERGIQIHATDERIMAEIGNLHNWKHWQPVFKTDSAQIKIKDGTLSQTASWMAKGKEVKINLYDRTPQSVKFTISREGELDIDNGIILLPVEESQSSKQVQWRAITHLRWYPWEKLSGIFTEKISGPSIDSSLQSLQQYLIKNP
ncbi:MAG: hypothetical protein IPL97_08860 [Niastella sp.]|nr:hypothetical protein [Niastella sp.]